MAKALDRMAMDIDRTLPKDVKFPWVRDVRLLLLLPLSPITAFMLAKKKTEAGEMRVKRDTTESKTFYKGVS
jgi:hypothetical protein